MIQIEKEKQYKQEETISVREANAGSLSTLVLFPRELLNVAALAVAVKTAPGGEGPGITAWC